MLRDGKSGLTKAVVMGPGQAILFYGRWSLGEGLSLSEVCNTMFTLTGAISLVGKQAQLYVNALTLQEGQWLIAQANTKWCVEARGPGCPCTCPPALLPLGFVAKMGPYQRWGSQVPMNACRSLGILTRCHIMTGAMHHNGDRTAVRGGRTYGLPCPCHLHLDWIMGLRVTRVQHQLLHQCHPGLIGLEAPDVHTMADTTGNLEAIWKSTCQTSRTRTQKMPSLIKVGIGLDSVSLHWVPGLHPSPLCYPLPRKLSRGVGEKFRERCHFGWHTWHTGWTLQQYQGLRYFEPGALSAANGWKGDSVGGASVKASPNPCGIIPRMLSTRPHHWVEVWPLLGWAA